MQDKETDTYWSIMQGKAVAGKFRGTELRELVAEKTTWSQWKQKHPDTRVWSLGGRQDRSLVTFDQIQNSNGFRGLIATDERLATKDPVFGFLQQGEAVAVSFDSFVDGATFQLAEGSLFLFRLETDPVERSTVAYFSTAGFESIDGKWQEKQSKNMFDVASRKFVDQIDGERDSEVELFARGFDTWWYNWSLNNPQTRLLE